MNTEHSDRDKTFTEHILNKIDFSKKMNKSTTLLLLSILAVSIAKESRFRRSMVMGHSCSDPPTQDANECTSRKHGFFKNSCNMCVPKKVGVESFDKRSEASNRKKRNKCVAHTQNCVDISQEMEPFYPCRYRLQGELYTDEWEHDTLGVGFELFIERRRATAEFRMKAAKYCFAEVGAARALIQKANACPKAQLGPPYDHENNLKKWCDAVIEGAESHIKKGCLEEDKARPLIDASKSCTSLKDIRALHDVFLEKRFRDRNWIEEKDLEGKCSGELLRQAMDNALVKYFQSAYSAARSLMKYGDKCHSA